MKILFAVFFIFLLNIFFQKNILIINYYYEGNYVSEIQRGLEYWNTNNLSFKETKNIKEACLIIKHSDHHIKTPRWLAQYNCKTKTIYLNNKFESVLKGVNLSGVVAHEAGHFLGLPHNNENDSVMNIETLYSTTPSNKDKERVSNLIPALCIKKIIDQKIFNK